MQVHRPHWCGFLSGSWRWRLYGSLSLPGPLPRPPCRWLPGTARTKRFASSPAVVCTHQAYWYLTPAPQGLNAPTEPYTRSTPHTTDPEELVRKTTSHISFRDWVMGPVMQAFTVVLLRSLLPCFSFSSVIQSAYSCSAATPGCNWTKGHFEASGVWMVLCFKQISNGRCNIAWFSSSSSSLVFTAEGCRPNNCSSTTL